MSFLILWHPQSITNDLPRTPRVLTHSADVREDISCTSHIIWTLRIHTINRKKIDITDFNNTLATALWLYLLPAHSLYCWRPITGSKKIIHIYCASSTPYTQTHACSLYIQYIQVMISKGWKWEEGQRNQDQTDRETLNKNWMVEYVFTVIECLQDCKDTISVHIISKCNILKRCGDVYKDTGG